MLPLVTPLRPALTSVLIILYYTVLYCIVLYCTVV